MKKTILCEKCKQKLFIYQETATTWSLSIDKKTKKVVAKKDNKEAPSDEIYITCHNPECETYGTAEVMDGRNDPFDLAEVIWE